MKTQSVLPAISLRLAFYATVNKSIKKTTEQNELIGQMQHTLKTVIEHERRQTQRLTAAKFYFDQMKYDLHEVVQHFHGKDELKVLFVSFHNKDMRNEKIEDIQLDEDLEDEHKRQKVTLEKQLTELTREHMRDDQFHNVALINELQGLRVQNKHLISTALISKKQTAADRRLLLATEVHTSANELFEAQPCHFSKKKLIGRTGAFGRALRHPYAGRHRDFGHNHRQSYHSADCADDACLV
jgi:hypothetical protein